jgi:hypothetical protein
VKSIELSRPQFGFVVATRVLLGIGIGLLVADRLKRRDRERIGRKLVRIGIFTTAPAMYFVFKKRKTLGSRLAA